MAAAIFAVNLVLSGDNGIVIAMAAARLPHRQKFRAIAVAASMAAILLVLATSFATQVLHLAFLRLVGGAVVLWIAINLFRDQASTQQSHEQSRSFWGTVWFVVLVDLSVSTDNVLAVAAMAKGNVRLLIAGLGLSVPIVVFASGFLSTLIERNPIITYVGAAMLGSMGIELALTDPLVVAALRPTTLLLHWAQAIAAVSIVASGRWMSVRRRTSLAEG